MCHVTSFLCCIDPIVGGLLLGYCHFGIAIVGFLATTVASLLILAKNPSILYFTFFVALILLFFIWSVCSWSFIKGVSYREARKIRHFKFFTFFCLILKFIVLIGALCTTYELVIVREQKDENFNLVLFGLSHFLIFSILWEFYILIFTNSLEMTFEEEEDEKNFYPETYHNLIKV